LILPLLIVIKSRLLTISLRTKPLPESAFRDAVKSKVDRKLQINVLRDGEYIQVETSSIFPDLSVIAGITKFVEMSRTEGTSPALRAFRQWVRERIL
jgi:hypothetical protein